MGRGIPGIGGPITNFSNCCVFRSFFSERSLFDAGEFVAIPLKK